MSTRQLTDPSGYITDGYTFDAFGVLLDKFGATDNDYLYAYNNAINLYDPSGFSALALPAGGVKELGLSISMSNILFGISAIAFGIAIGLTIELIRRHLRFRVYHNTPWRHFLLIRKSGYFLPNKEGKLYFSPSPYFLGRSASRRLSLWHTPDVCISIITYPMLDRLRPVWNNPESVDPEPTFGYGRVGGGFQYWTDIPVPYHSRKPYWWPLLY
jgi:hypothetical protein